MTFCQIFETYPHFLGYYLILNSKVLYLRSIERTYLPRIARLTCTVLWRVACNLEYAYRELEKFNLEKFNLEKWGTKRKI